MKDEEPKMKTYSVSLCLSIEAATVDEAREKFYDMVTAGDWGSCSVDREEETE